MISAEHSWQRVRYATPFDIPRRNPASSNAGADAVELDVLSWAHLAGPDDDRVDRHLRAQRSVDPADSGTLVVEMFGGSCRSGREFLLHSAEKLHFPGYYGVNWDAFRECLYDLFVLDEGGLGSYFGDRPGIAADGALLILHEADQLLVEASGELPILLGILGELVLDLPEVSDPTTTSHADRGVLFRCTTSGRCARAVERAVQQR